MWFTRGPGTHLAWKRNGKGFGSGKPHRTHLTCLQFPVKGSTFSKSYNPEIIPLGDPFNLKIYNYGHEKCTLSPDVKPQSAICSHQAGAQSVPLALLSSSWAFFGALSSPYPAPKSLGPGSCLAMWPPPPGLFPFPECFRFRFIRGAWGNFGRPGGTRKQKGEASDGNLWTRAEPFKHNEI